MVNKLALMGRWPGLRYFAPLGLRKLHGDGVQTQVVGLGFVISPRWG